MKKNVYYVIIKATRPGEEEGKEYVARVQRKCESETPIEAISETLSSVSPEWGDYYTHLTNSVEINISCKLAEANEGEV